jgi:adhesin/invasin
VGVLAAVCTVLSCGEDAAAPPRAATVRVVAGHGVTRVVGALVPVAVRVEDAAGQGVGNVGVAWVVTGGNGSVNGTTATTNSAGEAFVGWTLGTMPGPNTLTATVAGIAPVTFAATATVGAPASVVVVSGNHQTAGPGDELPLPVVVRVRDAQGNGVPGVAVHLSSLSGSFVPPIVLSNESGEASATGCWVCPRGRIRRWPSYRAHPRGSRSR